MLQKHAEDVNTRLEACPVQWRAEILNKQGMRQCSSSLLSLSLAHLVLGIHVRTALQQTRADIAVPADACNVQRCGCGKGNKRQQTTRRSPQQKAFTQGKRQTSGHQLTPSSNRQFAFAPSHNNLSTVLKSPSSVA